MRADRLISMLMLLQVRGRLTAGELAEELEVSVRTIYRDLTALSTAGVPVYCERGSRGGVRLLEEYRTTLTGMNPNEARALFMLSIPEPLIQLGIGPELKAALRKLSAALPASGRQEQVLARQRIHLDSSGWFQGESVVPCLGTIHTAVWQDRLVRMKYRLNFGTRVEREIAPYGLVAKGNRWHLVYTWGSGIRVVPVAQVTEAQVLPESFTRPADFDLEAFWQAWCAQVERQQRLYKVRVRLSPAFLPLLEGGDLNPSSQPSLADAHGWVTIELVFESLSAARTRLLGMGCGVEVLEPEALRKSVIDFAAQITRSYTPRNDELTG